LDSKLTWLVYVKSSIDDHLIITCQRLQELYA
jgi:hypothetical protein